MNVLKFEYPLMLHALWGVVALVLFYTAVFKQKEKALKKFGHLQMIMKMMPGYSLKRRIWKTILFIMAYIFLTVGLSGPQIGTRMEEVKRTGVDIMIALDVSLSMHAEDIKPNRLQKAKHEISKLIDLLEGDRIGLLAFAGMAHIHAPLTLDYSAAKLFLNMMDINLIPVPGTAIGAAIRKSMEAFNRKDRKHKALIVITDGEDHDTQPIEAAEAAAKEGIRIYTIGLGSANGAPIPVYDKFGKPAGFKKDKNGSVVTTKLDMETLQKIAYLTEGKYYISSAGETELAEIFADINKMEQKELKSKQFTQYENRFQIFILIGLILLLFEMFLPETRKYAEA
jgi:Ca-activated chloride channel family protein